jgi:hypothetical protein
MSGETKKVEDIADGLGSCEGRFVLAVWLMACGAEAAVLAGGGGSDGVGSAGGKNVGAELVRAERSTSANFTSSRTS